MKLHALLSIVSFVIAVTLLAQGEATNSTWGYVGRYDRLLHRQVVIAGSHWLQVVSRDVVYPPRGYINYFNITAIKAIDRDRKNGGYAALYSGGVGARNVTLHLKSQRNHGINFTVEIYGR